MNSDYPRVADDLVRLGFVPEDRADPEKTAAAVPQLTRVMSQLIQGGGVRKINIQQVRSPVQLATGQEWMRFEKTNESNFLTVLRRTIYGKNFFSFIVSKCGVVCSFADD